MRACRAEALDGTGLPLDLAGPPLRDSAADRATGTVVLDVPGARAVRIEALDAQTLRPRWTVRVDRRLRALEAGGGTVAVARDGNFIDEGQPGELAGPQLAALDGRTGRLRWRVDRPLPTLHAALRRQGVTFSFPAVAAHRVLAVANPARHRSGARPSRGLR